MTVMLPRGCFLILVILFGITGFGLLAKGETGAGVMTLVCVAIGVLRLMFEKSGR